MCFGLKLQVKGGLNNLIFFICLSNVGNLVLSNGSEHEQNVIQWRQNSFFFKSPSG